MRSDKTRLFGLSLAAAMAALALTGPAASAADPPALQSPGGGAVRALIIGIDAYRSVRPLKGAVADARDIESSLRRMGIRDITAIIDGQAERNAVLREIGSLVQRTAASDTVVLSIAGHGAQEPERVKGSEPDGMENVFLLPGFDTSPTGSQQRILGKEFNHFIKQLELKGAQVLFVADTCHGGGLAREIDPRAEEMSYRQVASYRVPVDLLQPVTTTADVFATELDFDRTTFLAAVDRKTKAPEVRIPGIDGLRGALSYAMARAIEGNADSDGDGKITLKELLTNVRQVVYQLSEQRQNIVTVTSPSRNIDQDIAFELTRGVHLVEATEPSIRKQGPGGTIAFPPLPKSTDAEASRIQKAVRIAALDGQGAHFNGLPRREAPFEVVRPVDYPDIIWDPKSRDVLAWGDVVAYAIDKSELPSVIDRAAAVRELKQMATKTPQAVRLAPDDRLHRSDTIVQVRVAEVANRALILFNIAGDGTVQMLYPVESDSPIVQSPDFALRMRIREPFGADQIIAITAEKRMSALEEALNRLKGRRVAAQAIAMVRKHAPADARIGATGLFTAP
jgi:Caspase domain